MRHERERLEKSHCGNKIQGQISWVLSQLILCFWCIQLFVSNIPLVLHSIQLKMLCDVNSGPTDNFGGTDFCIGYQFIHCVDEIHLEPLIVIHCLPSWNQSNGILYQKIFFFIPKDMDAWVETAKIGNPTLSTLIACIIKHSK